MEELGNFGGYIVALEKGIESLSVRMLSWNALREDIKPVLSITVNSYKISSGDSAPNLEEVKENEYEIDGIEIESNRILFWVYDFENPIIIECGKIYHQFEGLGTIETKMVLAANRRNEEEQYQQIVEFRNKLDTIDKFISETERRINIKSKNHTAESEANKMYKGQLELLSRLKRKLNT